MAKSPIERRTIILELIERERGADVLNRAFVEDFAEATGAKYRPAMWGAGWCPTLSADLRKMAKAGLLKRTRTGLAGNWQPGFPKWVYSYRLSKIGEQILELDRAAQQGGPQE